jgi:hypothetical protein
LANPFISTLEIHLSSPHYLGRKPRAPVYIRVLRTRSLHRLLLYWNLGIIMYTYQIRYVWTAMTHHLGLQANDPRYNLSTLAAWLRPEVHPSILLGYNRQRLTASGFDLLSGNYGFCGKLEEIQGNCLFVWGTLSS